MFPCYFIIASKCEIIFFGHEISSILVHQTHLAYVVPTKLFIDSVGMLFCFKKFTSDLDWVGSKILLFEALIHVKNTSSSQWKQIDEPLPLQDNMLICAWRSYAQCRNLMTALSHPLQQQLRS